MTMKKTIHRSENRGYANHGWLIARHSFSFAQWYNPNLVQFGALRVLNDDEVAPGMGFGKHPHDNMEIITLVQEGALKHQDSMGNGSTMRPGDVQVMSAGTGVFHSEMNASGDEWVKLFQIWIFPDKQQVAPRYDQKHFPEEGRAGKWQEIIKPDTQPEGDAIFIHQQAWLSLADLEPGSELSYTLRREGNGAYFYIIDGNAEIAGEQLKRRDALGIEDFKDATVKASTKLRILVLDIPSGV